MSGILATHAFRRPAASRQGWGWTEWMRDALRTVGTRRQLAQMEDRMLKDIGISRADALEEANRAPWDLGPKGFG